MGNVKASIRKAQIIGTLQEMNFDIQTKEIERDGKKIKCQAIVKKEFKNPSMTVDVNGMPVGVDFIPTYEIGKDGKHNQKFDGMKTIIETYVPAISATEENPATRVKVNGMFGLNEYVDKNDSYKSFPNITCFSPCTHTNVPSDDMAAIEVTGIIGALKDEVEGEDTTETGRLNLTFCSFDKEGNILPFDLIVPEDLADDFKENYEVNDSCELGLEITTKQSGQTKTSNRTFGKKSQIVGGYSKPEYVVNGGDPKFEEEHQYYIDFADVKDAMKLRKIMIQAAIDKKKEEASKPKETKTKKGLGSIKKIESPVEDDDDCPFGEEEDSLF